jgi:sulfonate transport system permease protein
MGVYVAGAVQTAERPGQGPPGGRPRARARAARPRDHGGVRRLLGPLLLVALWQLASAVGLLSPRTLAPPTAVVSTGVDLLLAGDLHRHFLVSLRRALLGLGIGVTVGSVLAVTAAVFRVAEDLIDAPMQILRALPILALVPLAILWLGIGEEVKIALVALGTTFPIYLNTHAAIRGVDPRFAELARTVGVSRLELVRRVILPGALPGFFVGLRFAVQIAWLVLVVSEQINASSGVGFLMMQAREFYRTDVIVVGLVIYGVLGLSSDLFVRWLERSVLPWRRTFAVR